MVQSTGDQIAEDSEGGSRWHRWEPHIHAPGTAINDQFTAHDAWSAYVTALEAAVPAISAVGVTDYYSLDVYDHMVGEKKSGRLANCGLIFPNVEMRLKVGTVKGRWANIHLLVNPTDPNHIQETKRFLGELSFQAYGDTFRCNRGDLIRLGRRHDASATAEAAALEVGSQQFKVSFDELRAAYRASEWAQANILIAVAGSETDGTSGIRDAADATLRQEVEQFAHVIFASSEAQREFWLGRKGVSVEKLRERYGGPKPCLHGSDAHALCKVALPDGDRYSWLKGAVAFDSLFQACIDPSGRAMVGAAPPLGAPSSQVISEIRVDDASWTQMNRLTLNPGLVAIIGARGSGKTALADMIAAGCDSTAGQLSETSFLVRAAEFLPGVTVNLHWQTGEKTKHDLASANVEDPTTFPRARYLSQRFVEELCTADGMADSLVQEIERVIFEAHPLAGRAGTVDFQELKSLRVDRFRIARAREVENIANLSDRLGAEIEKGKLVANTKSQIQLKEQLIAGYTNDRSKLVTKDSEKRVARLAELAEAAETVRGYLRYYANQEQSLLRLRDAVDDLRRNQAPEALRRTKEQFSATGIQDTGWDPFLIDYKGDVDAAVTNGLREAQTGATNWRGAAVSPPVDPNSPIIAADADLKRTPLSVLDAETERLQKLVSTDRLTAQQFATLSRRIAEEATALTKLNEQLADYEKSPERVRDLNQQRQDSYKRIFDTIAAEENVLRELYKPLMERLANADGTLKKLNFAVSRVANMKQWAEEGEAIIDLSRKGPFKGKGTLLVAANATLKAAWETGDSGAVDTAMAAFRHANQEGLLEHSPVPRADQANYREWLKRFARWLYSTEHLTIHYSIDYEGVEIRKLSPGTRGIVLLLLYLALDQDDDRPLIIDQPEESLDPKSIFDELVGLFISAKSKRQVIMVTHNANLVVNTDADQVIVAEAGPHPPNQLPPITYRSGGLENATIRKAVCDILEGGEEAFKERARRLRVRLKR